MTRRKVPPLTGGIRIESPKPHTSPTFNLCSTGFAVRIRKSSSRNPKGSYRVLTAGHCGRPGSHWRYRRAADHEGSTNNVGTGTPFGKMTKNLFPASAPPSSQRPTPSYVDAAMIGEPSRFRTYLVRLRSNSFKSITAVQQLSQGHSKEEGGRGDTVCQDGATSLFKYGRQQCGELLRKNVTLKFSDGIEPG